ncbi:MAG: hypothetical protein ICV54_04335 [Nostoc sp. C3-bin3]|nr:hypothetical protein [Nostoc sp. C3-bin3]
MALLPVGDQLVQIKLGLILALAEIFQGTLFFSSRIDLEPSRSEVSGE